MGKTPKNLDEAIRAGREMLASRTRQGRHQKGCRAVARGVSLQERREVLEQVVPEYRGASGEQKRLLLNRFVLRTGYHRTYACWLLNQHKQDESSRPRPRHYGTDVQEALVFAWNGLFLERYSPEKGNP